MSTVFIVRRAAHVESMGCIVAVSKTLDHACKEASDMVKRDQFCSTYVVIEQKVGTTNRQNKLGAAIENIVRTVSRGADQTVYMTVPPKPWEQ